MLSHSRRGIAYTELVDRSRKLLSVVLAVGGRATPTAATSSGSLRAESIREAAQMFVDAELVDVHSRSRSIEDDSILTPIEKKRLVLDTSKNIIVHFFVERALVAVAVLAPSREPAIPLDTVRDRVQALSRLFKHEFRFRADAPFARIFDETVSAMKKSGALASDDKNAIVPGPGSDGYTGHEWLERAA